MTGFIRRAALAGAILVFAAVASEQARADSVSDFYSKKDIKILVAFSAGGGYDLYARTLSQHMGRHIAGKPNIILQFMPGAGGAKAANYFANVAPHDGSMIAMLSNSAALAQVLQRGALRYDVRKFAYIGRMADMRSALIIWHTAPVKSLADARTTPIIFGSTGKSSQDYMNPMLFQNVLGYKVDVVMGYKGSRPINNAMEKGEVHAMFNSWSSVKARLGQWLEKGQIRVLAMQGLTRAPDLRKVPTLLELADSEEDRNLVELMASTTAVGRAFAVPGDVPAARVAALRAAFAATMKDPEFLADAEKRKVDLDPLSGEEVQKIVNKTANAPDALVAKFREALDLQS